MSVDVQPTFKVPESLPQDLLLIQELVGEALISPKNSGKAPLAAKPALEEDDISSSGSEDDSEDELNEVEADLEVTAEEDDDIPPVKIVVPSDSSSESDSDPDSGSDSHDLNDNKTSADKKVHDEEYDDEDSGPPITTTTYFQTKNELADVEITIPTVEEVGLDEVLEKVGEIMRVVGNVVIVKGMANGVAGRVSEQALDSDTLLVFENRKVLGYIYETFGPTFEPLYQVKFNQQYPLDPEKVQLKKWKGSDASNVYDEEPADDELEFSDDEDEAAFRSQRKKKRGESRANSVASSRHATPTPSQMRDQDLIDESFGTNAYDERGPYDIDFSSAGPSRPPPIPYDDPYSNEYNAEASGADPATPDAVGDPNKGENPNDRYSPTLDGDRGLGRVRGRGRGRGGGHDRGKSRRDSGGRGRGRGWGARGRGGRRNGDETLRATGQPEEPNDPLPPRPLSPTSLVIARATGQLSGPELSSDPGMMQQSAQMPTSPGAWQFQQSSMQPQQQTNFGAQQPFVQPHINPRFASQFGMNFGLMQPQLYPQYGQYGFSSHNAGSAHSGGNWADEWTVHRGDTDGYRTGRDNTGSGDQSAGNS